MHASTFVTVAMAVIPLTVAVAVVTGVAKVAGRKAALWLALGIAAWMTVLAVLARAGVLARFDARPPPILIVLLILIATAIAFARSRLGARLAALPLAALVGLHAFRLPLELVMHEAANEGTMPGQMTFTNGGWNFDIVTGATAIVVALLAARGKASPALLRAWNMLGMALLLVVATIGVSSTPIFGAFGTEDGRLNTWIARPPFVWLPGVLVATALAGHLILWRRLGLPGARLPPS